MRKEPDWREQVCDGIAGPVYLTIDVDVFDPAVMPATGTPEPDGLNWRDVTDFLKALTSSKQVVGADFVEFAPFPGGHHASFTIAKLIYRTFGYIFRRLVQANNK